LREAELWLGVTVMLLVSGVTLGVIALVKRKRLGNRRPVVLGTIGVAINGLLIGAIVDGFIVGRTNSRVTQQRVQQTLAGIGRVSKFSQNATNRIESDIGLLDKVRESWEAAAAFSEGAEKLQYQAAAGYTSRLQTAMDRFDEAVTGLSNNNVFTPQRVSHKAALKELRKSVEHFLDGNEEFQSFLSQSDAVFSNELVSAKADQTEILRGISSFRAAQAQFLPLVLTMSSLDSEMARTSIEIIDLLERRWGEWEYEPSTDALISDDKLLMEDYSRLIQQIQAVRRRQFATRSRVERLTQKGR
jgi:hypothetical protein